MRVRHAIQPSRPLNLIDIRFDQDNQLFTVSTLTGFAIHRTWPLALLRKRDIYNGALAIIQPIHTSSLLLLVGGRPSPLYPQNKVVVWDDAVGHEVAELEFRERVLGLASRRGWIAVALKRRVVVFKLEDEAITRYREYETSVNLRGLVCLATAPNSTLLTMPGRQSGHVQLVHLPPCPAPGPPPVQPPPTPYEPPAPTPAPRAPPINVAQHHARTAVSIIAAHKSPLATLSVPASGRLLATTSDSGTLIRIWDTHSGELIRELRRGTDKAEIYGVAFRPDETEVCVWSDKGTVHVFKILGGAEGGESGGNRQSTLQQLSPFIRLPKYFSSEWSYASYRLPAPTAHITLSSALRGGGERGDGGKKMTDDGDPVEDAPAEKCIVGWIEVPIRVPVSTSATTAKSPTAPSRERGKSRASFSAMPSSPKGKSKALPEQTSEPPPGDRGYREEMQWQLVVLTYSGCWYRLSVPTSSSSNSSTATPAEVLPANTRLKTSAPITVAAPIPVPTRQTRTPGGTGGGPLSASPPKSVLRAAALSSTPPRPSPLHTITRAPSNAPSTSAASTVRGPSTVTTTTGKKGKEREASTSLKRRDSSATTKNAAEKVSRKCNLEEFHRFGRWDGWI